MIWYEDFSHYPSHHRKHYTDLTKLIPMLGLILTTNISIYLIWLSYITTHHWQHKPNVTKLLRRHMLLTLCYTSLWCTWATHIRQFQHPLLFPDHTLSSSFFITTALILSILWLSTIPASALPRMSSDQLISAHIVTIGCIILPHCLALPLAYIGIELVALSSYALICSTRSSEFSIEASMKYYVLGAISSIILLLALTLHLLSTSSLQLQDSSLLLMAYSADTVPISLFASSDAYASWISCMLVALGLKLAVAPLHGWFPEVLDGMNSGVLALLVALPKLALLAWFSMSVLIIGPQFLSIWVFLVSSGCSVMLGLLGALAALSWKRLMGFSGIVHAGLLILPLFGYSLVAYSVVWLYALIYGILAWAWSVLMSSFVVGNAGVRHLGWVSVRYWSDLVNLTYLVPSIVMALAVIIMNLVGLPPFVGFHAKLLVLLVAVLGTHVGSLIILLIVKLLAGIYYLRVLSWVLLVDIVGYSGRLLWLSMSGFRVGSCLIVGICGASVIIYMKPILLVLLLNGDLVVWWWWGLSGIIIFL